MINDGDIGVYARDGAVCLRHAFEPAWIDSLRIGFARDMGRPGARASIFSGDGSGFLGVGDPALLGRYTGDVAGESEPRFINDVNHWRAVPEFEQFLFRSPAAAMAGRLMGASRINLFLQDVMLKEPGATTPTPWHHDVPFWPIEGRQICTIWIPLDRITVANGIEFIRGSHRWGKSFLPLDMPDTEAHYGADVSDFTQIPDVDADRSAYEFLSGELEPGDCIVFDGHVLHGAPGNATDAPRRVFTARWIGEDIRYNGDKHRQLAPAYPDCGLENGAPMNCETFPLVWRA